MTDTPAAPTTPRIGCCEHRGMAHTGFGIAACCLHKTEHRESQVSRRDLLDELSRAVLTRQTGKAEGLAAEARSARSTPAEALHSVEIPETMDAMPTHDNGCRCWPHVSRRDAERAIEAVALAEYRSRSAEALDTEQIELIGQAISDIVRYHLLGVRFGNGVSEATCDELSQRLTEAVLARLSRNEDRTDA